MGGDWSTGYADELARVLADALACAETCERYLERASPERLERDVHILAAPAAVSRVLIDVLDQPSQSVPEAVRLCRELSAGAAAQLEGQPDVTAALRRVSGSAGALLDAIR